MAKSNNQTSKKNSNTQSQKITRKTGAITGPNGEEFEFGLELAPCQSNQSSSGKRSSSSSKKQSNSKKSSR